MKKVFVAALAVMALLSAASCKKSDKCICTYETSILKPQDVKVNKPDDKKCSELTSEDINLAGIKIDASGVVKVSCKNANE